MHLTSLKRGPRGREESYGAIGPIAHGETVTGVHVQEVERKHVRRINKKVVLLLTGIMKGNVSLWLASSSLPGSTSSSCLG